MRGRACIAMTDIETRRWITCVTRRRCLARATPAATRGEKMKKAADFRGLPEIALEAERQWSSSSCSA